MKPKKKLWKWSEVREHGGKEPVEPETAVDPRTKPGRCGNCAHGEVELAIVKRHLLKSCKRCGQVVDTDDDMKVIRKGEAV